MAGSALEKIVEASLSKASSAGEAQLRKARLILFDIVSVASAGFLTDPKPQRLLASFARELPGPCTVMGYWSKTEPVMAAVINAFSSHVLELDDWLAPSYTYAGASIVPTVLALSEMNGATLEQACRALIAGYEAAGRVGLLLGRKHYAYWHTSCTAGGVGAAVAAAYLASGASAEAALKSAYVAAVYGGGVKPLIWKNIQLKPFSPAHAAFVGLMSSALSGFVTRVPPVYEPDNGVCKLMQGECNLEGAANPPWTYAVESVTHKIFPVSRVAQTLVRAALKAREEVDVNRVSSVWVETFEEAYYLADVLEPVTVEEARFSITFLAALSLVEGWQGVFDIKRYLFNPRVRSLEKKVRVVVRDDFTAMYPEKQPVRLVVCEEGSAKKCVEAYEDTPIGSPECPGLEGLVKEKSRHILQAAGDERGARVVEKILALPASSSVREIFD